MHELNIKYSIEIVKSSKGNDCIKLTLQSPNGETHSYFGHGAVKESEKYKMLLGEDFVNYIIGLKKITDRAYKDKEST